MADILDVVFADKDIILYRPEFRKITGSVTSAILLQQILYRWKGNKREAFYKFKEPCKHKAYKKGDSWCEELGFGRKEFDTALKKIAKKRKEKGSEKALIVYWIGMDRMTYYCVNEPEIRKVLIGIYQSPNGALLKSQSDVTNDPNGLYVKYQSDDSYTENTTEDTTKTTTENKEISREFDPVQEIKKKILSATTFQKESWKARFSADPESLAFDAEDFAAWWIGRQTGKSENMLKQHINQTSAKVFQMSFQTSWLSRKAEFKSKRKVAPKEIQKSEDGLAAFGIV